MTLDQAKSDLHTALRAGCMTDWQYRTAAMYASEDAQTARRIAYILYQASEAIGAELKNLNHTVNGRFEPNAASVLMLESLDEHFAPEVVGVVRAAIEGDA